MTGDGMSPDDAVSVVRSSIEHSGLMPDDMSYLEEEVAPENRDITLPALILQPLSSIRITDFNTDFDSFVLDSEGNQVARVFTAEYRLDIQLDIWTVSGSSHDEHTLGEKLRQALYAHDSNGPEQPLVDENGDPVDSVWRFRVSDGEQANDLTMTPTLRRWRQDVALWSFYRFDTSEDYIAEIDYPSDFSDDGDGMLEG